MQQKRFEDLKNAAERPNHGDILSMEMFTEDWNSSQFWVLLNLIYLGYVADVLSTVTKLLRSWQSNCLKEQLRRRQSRLYLHRVSSSRSKTH